MQIQKKPGDGSGKKRQIIREAAFFKAPEEAIRKQQLRGKDGLILSIRTIGFYDEYRGPVFDYSGAIKAAAELAKALNRPDFESALREFDGQPFSKLAVLGICSLLPEKIEARAYLAKNLNDSYFKSHAAKAIINSFLRSLGLLEIINEKVPGIKKHVNSIDQPKALAQGVFVSMKEFFGIEGEEFKVMKKFYNIFTEKFSKFCDANNVWPLLYK